MKIFRDILLIGYLLALTSMCITNVNPDIQLKKLDKTLVRVFRKLEKVSKCELQITSGWRSERRNKAVGGTPNSFHLMGKAVDVYPRKCSLTVSQLGSIATRWFNGVIVYPGHLHIDIGKRKYHYLGKRK